MAHVVLAVAALGRQRIEYEDLTYDENPKKAHLLQATSPRV